MPEFDLQELEFIVKRLIEKLIDIIAKDQEEPQEFLYTFILFVKYLHKFIFAHQLNFQKNPDQYGYSKAVKAFGAEDFEIYVWSPVFQALIDSMQNQTQGNIGKILWFSIHFEQDIFWDWIGGDFNRTFQSFRVYVENKSSFDFTPRDERLVDFYNNFFNSIDFLQEKTKYDIASKEHENKFIHSLLLLENISKDTAFYEKLDLSKNVLTKQIQYLDMNLNDKKIEAINIFQSQEEEKNKLVFFQSLYAILATNEKTSIAEHVIQYYIQNINNAKNFFALQTIFQMLSTFQAVNMLIKLFDGKVIDSVLSDTYLEQVLSRLFVTEIDKLKIAEEIFKFSFNNLCHSAVNKKILILCLRNIGISNRHAFVSMILGYFYDASKINAIPQPEDKIIDRNVIAKLGLIKEVLADFYSHMTTQDKNDEAIFLCETFNIMRSKENAIKACMMVLYTQMSSKQRIYAFASLLAKLKNVTGDCTNFKISFSVLYTAMSPKNRYDIKMYLQDLMVDGNCAYCKIALGVLYARMSLSERLAEKKRLLEALLLDECNLSVERALCVLYEQHSIDERKTEAKFLRETLERLKISDDKSKHIHVLVDKRLKLIEANLHILYEQMSAEERKDEAECLFKQLSSGKDCESSKKALYLLYDVMRKKSAQSVQPTSEISAVRDLINNSIALAHNSLPSQNESLFEVPSFAGKFDSDFLQEQVLNTVNMAYYVATCNLYKELCNYISFVANTASPEVFSAIYSMQTYLVNSLRVIKQKSTYTTFSNNLASNATTSNLHHNDEGIIVAHISKDEEVKKALTILEANIPVGIFEKISQWIAIVTGWIFGGGNESQAIETSNKIRNKVETKIISFLSIYANQDREEWQSVERQL